MTTINEPRIIRAGEGLVLGPPGSQDRFMIDAGDTGGRMAVVEHILGPAQLAAPMHLHTAEDEFSYVLEGRVGAILSGRVVYAEPGDLVFKPRGEWHTFWNAGDGTARILELISPAGLDQLFRRLDVLTEELDPDEFARMAAEFGCSLDLEATGPLVERHGLVF